jgi:hypothetical protein
MAPRFAFAPAIFVGAAALIAAIFPEKNWPERIFAAIQLTGIAAMIALN